MKRKISGELKNPVFDKKNNNKTALKRIGSKASFGIFREEKCDPEYILVKRDVLEKNCKFFVILVVMHYILLISIAQLFHTIQESTSQDRAAVLVVAEYHSLDLLNLILIYFGHLNNYNNFVNSIFWGIDIVSIRNLTK